jgi:predicted nucleic acid-binding protein
MTKGAEPLIYLDAMAFIVAIEGEPSVAEPMTRLLKVLRLHSGVGVTSELTLAEVLAGSALAQASPVKRTYLDLIVSSKFLDLVPISREVLYTSARLRHAHLDYHGKKLRLADALHLATSTLRSCRYFVSADKGIRPPMGMERVAPDAAGIDEILKAIA